jgi:ketosteroid isomerase-like protein
MFKVAVGTLLVLAIGVAGSAQSPRRKTTDASRDAIRKADQNWLRVFATKHLDESVGFVLSNGSVLAPNALIATGRDAIGKLFSAFFALPDLKIEWHPVDIGVARSGELGYSTGAYKMSFKDPGGKTVEDHGKYVTVWKKQSNGKWKVAYDIFNSDLPQTSP